jgi:hypothetical protein
LIRGVPACLAAGTGIKIGIVIDSTRAVGSSKAGMATPIQIGPDMEMDTPS